MKFGHHNFAKHRVTFEPEKLEEYLNQMVAENPCTDFDGNESNASETGSNRMDADSEVGDFMNETYRKQMPKRSATRPSSRAAHVKKVRNETEVVTIFDTMERNFKNYAERETLKMKRHIGQHLQNRQDEMNNEKNVLKQTIDMLNVQKSDLERACADLEKQLIDEKKRFDAEKLVSEQEIAELKEAQRKSRSWSQHCCIGTQEKRNKLRPLPSSSSTGHVL